MVDGRCKSWLIKPDANWQHWSLSAEGMHGITPEQLLSEGVNAEQVVDELVAFLEGSDGVLYSDAVNWDSHWLDKLFYTVKSARRFHIASIYDLLKGKETDFDTAKALLAASGKYRHHRAEEDVRMIYAAYLAGC